jgi:hypothetical protein
MQRILATFVLLAGASLLRAQTTQPALAALDRDVQGLFTGISQSVVRVNVPVLIPNRIAEQEHPFFKYRSLIDPKLLAQLEAARARGGARVYIEQRPATTQSSTQAAGGEMNRIPMPATTIVNAEFIGLVLNKTGDVLVPLHIDTAYLPSPRLQVTLDGEHVTTGVVVASDRSTSLSVIRLAQAAGEPVRFAKARPALGGLVMLLSPTRRAARLSVWAGGNDDNAVVVNLSGEVAGLVRNGHALYPTTLTPIIGQLVAGQKVQRARLGVAIRDVPPEDPLRTRLTALGARAAARVEEVMGNSPAEQAGIKPGDLIIGFADEPVEDVASFAAAIANHRGRTVLRIIRDGQEQSIPVNLQAD